MKPAVLVTTVFLVIVAVFHVVRYLIELPVTAGDLVIPVWTSVFAAIFTGALAFWLWREQAE